MLFLRYHKRLSRVLYFQPICCNPYHKPYQIDCSLICRRSVILSCMMPRTSKRKTKTTTAVADESPAKKTAVETETTTAEADKSPAKKTAVETKTTTAEADESPAKKTAVEDDTADTETTQSFECDKKAANKKSWNLKISAWNTGGFKSWLKKGGMDYLKEEQPDILFLQETKIKEKDVGVDGKPEGYHFYWNASTSKAGYSGTALYSKTKPIDVKYGMGIEKHDAEGRLITAEYEKFYFVGCYVPNSGRKLVRLEYRGEWDTDFLEYIKDLKTKKPVIYAGDLNVAHLDIDLKNPKSNRNKTPGFTDQEREAFTELLEEGFVDSFRHLYPDKELTYSFWTYMMNCRAKNVGWRLDYFVLSEDLVPNLCESTMRSQTMGSDHCPIVLFMAM